MNRLRDLVLAEAEQASDILAVDHAVFCETFQTAFQPWAGIANGFSGVTI
ncbi:MAG: hypothetical protein ABSG66_02910 [Stellaceae bacterium]|jgi:hypothetical protein